MLSKCFAVIIPLLSCQLTLIHTQTLEITNGPMDTTVCTGSVANISCGFINGDPNIVVPDWRIVRRSDDGNVISNMTISGRNIIINNNDGLEWVADLTSGVNMSPNSRLLVGPVDETYNQSSYQCIFTTLSGAVESSIGTLTVAEIPPVDNLMVVDQCTIIRASWDITEGPCTHLSYDVTLLSSDGVILQGPFTTSDTVYNFTNVETLNGIFNVTVVPINGNARGANATETAVISVSPDDLPTVSNIRNTSRICVTYFDISWDAPSITCGDVYYEVSISPPPIEGDAVVTTVDSFLSVTGLSNSLPDVTITVTAINRAGRGDGRMFPVQLPKSLDLPTVSNIRNTSRICVTSLNISWDAPSITCGDIYYEVLISPPPIEGDAVVTTVDSFLSVTGLNNSLPDVTITVTAISRAGRGDGRMFPVQLPKSLDPPYTTAYNVTMSSSLTPADLSGFDIIISWNRPPIDPCTTLPITGYYIHAIVTNVNGDANERIYTSNHIDNTMSDGMDRFSVSYNDSFDQELEPNANYAFVVNTQNNIIEIPRTGTCPSCDDDESDDELSTAVIISIVVTFVITLVVTALITYIITNMYYNYRYELKEKVKVNDDKNVNTKQKDPYGGNITMDTNPAYGTATTIKMDTNPAYATTS